MIWEILFILVLILANGLFAAAEIALIAARKGRSSSGRQREAAMPRRALELSRNPDRFLPTVQIGISLVSALGAAYGGQQIVERIQAMVRRIARGRSSRGMPTASAWPCSWPALRMPR